MRLRTLLIPIAVAAVSGFCATTASAQPSSTGATVSRSSGCSTVPATVPPEPFFPEFTQCFTSQLVLNQATTPSQNMVATVHGVVDVTVTDPDCTTQARQVINQAIFDVAAGTLAQVIHQTVLFSSTVTCASAGTVSTCDTVLITQFVSGAPLFAKVTVDRCPPAA